MKLTDIFRRNIKVTEAPITPQIPEQKHEQRNSILEDALDGNYPIGGMTIVGSSARESHGCLALSTVYCAVEKISNSLATMPIILKTDDEQAKFTVKQHYLNKIFENGTISRYMLVKMMVSDMLLYGNGFAYIERLAGTPNSLRYIPATKVNIHYNEIRNELYYTCTLVSKGKIMPKDILHIYKNSDNGYEGRGLLKYASRTLKLANYTENAALDYYASGLNITGLLHAKSPMNKNQAEQAVKSLTSGIPTANTSNYIKFVPFDMSFEPMSQNAKDAALIENRVFNVQEIARYFGMSPVMLQDLSNSKYSNVEMANLDFLSNTLLTYIKIFEGEINRKLVTEDCYYLDMDEREFIRMDGKTSAEYYGKLVSSGIISVNEARDCLGYSPVDGADDLLIAYTDISQNTINGEESKDSENTEINNKNKD